MRERLGGSEADVERIVDDDATAVAASASKAATATKGEKPKHTEKRNKKAPKQGEYIHIYICVVGGAVAGGRWGGGGRMGHG